MKLHHLKPAEGSKTPRKRVGRGKAAGQGKTAGRGTKGYLARHNPKLGFEGGQIPLIRRVPKLKGFNNPNRVEFAVVNVDRLAAAFLTLATTGARRGEVLGLRWTDVDLDAARAAIWQTVIAVQHRVQFGEPKTAKGRRTIDLDAVTVAALREHRKRQAAERLLMGEGWTDHGLVFCRVDGGPLHPERFSRTFTTRVRQLGVPPIRLHDLRHGWATLALADGVHPKVVQERLGHANIGITLDIYSHVTEALHTDAAERVVAAIFGRPDSVG
jgi:integrase